MTAILALLASDALWVRLSPWCWAACILALSPALLRLLRGKGLSLDPIWAVALLLAVNRESFLLHVSRPLSHATAAALALVLAGVSSGYQVRDR